ncbi:MAG: hypothetical protein EOO89_00040 [Pedobacter sp.]|nr:MAG: hypothetical protein EOO89_00040 [Pedobacter sp.]
MEDLYKSHSKISLKQHNQILPKKSMTMKKNPTKKQKPEHNAILWSPLSNTDHLLTTLSFFTGIGGLDKGAKKAGFTTLFQTDIMKAAGDAFTLNKDNEIEYLKSEGVFAQGLTAGNIEKLNFDHISDLVSTHLKIQLMQGDIDVIHGGPPCQDISKCNNLRAVSSKKNQLIFELLRIIREAKPKVGLIEQVPDLKSWNYFKLWSEVKITLNRMTDYIWDYKVMDAANYGARQSRRRLIIMLVRKDLGVPVSFPEPMPVDLDKVTVKKLLPEIHFFSPGQYADDIKRADENIFCTMTATGSEKAYGVDGKAKDFKMSERLVLTELEGVILKGVPVTWQKKLVGNMVQISLAECLFNHIRSHILERSLTGRLPQAA